MGSSTDNLTGIILALLSSGFIGASFIIKKKGLRRAAVVSGVRAGVDGYYYLLEPLWWIGMITIQSSVGENPKKGKYAISPSLLSCCDSVSCTLLLRNGLFQMFLEILAPLDHLYLYASRSRFMDLSVREINPPVHSVVL